MFAQTKHYHHLNDFFFLPSVVLPQIFCNHLFNCLQSSPLEDFTNDSEHIQFKHNHFFSFFLFCSPSLSQFHTHTHTLLCPVKTRTMLLTSRAWVKGASQMAECAKEQWGNSLGDMSHSWHRFNPLITDRLIHGDIRLALCCGITIITDWNKPHFPLMPYCNVRCSLAALKGSHKSFTLAQTWSHLSCTVSQQ